MKWNKKNALKVKKEISRTIKKIKKDLKIMKNQGKCKVKLFFMQIAIEASENNLENLNYDSSEWVRRKRNKKYVRKIRRMKKVSGR